MSDKKAVGVKYATVFRNPFKCGGSSKEICTWHKTLATAIKAAKDCEKRGGLFHDEIWEVKVHKRRRPK